MRQLIAAVLLTACSFISLNTQAEAPKPAHPIIKMATTTSTDNSGLLAELLPAFEEQSGYTVQVIAVGTGKALRMGEDGDVDVVLVHARPAEDKFVAEGYGEKRYGVMYNDFVLVGPEDDPAKVGATDTAAAGLANIAAAEAVFVSRGDDSGTHKKEKSLWQAADVKPEGQWYREAGQGMGKVLQMAGELDAYTLTDRGTWLAYQSKLPLEIVLEGDEKLFNPYGIIAVNPERYPDINHTGAQTLIDWLVSEDGQTRINAFKLDGEQLFIANANADAEATEEAEQEESEAPAEATAE